jgi:Response regulator containing CheY-like receiver, AAA-type ATPase, and DNA-binding domains
MADTRDRFAPDPNTTERQQSILVVESNRTDLSETAGMLRAFGYRVAEASGFDDAKRMLAGDPPDCLIAGVRLGAYNGLHLIVRAHDKHPEMASILTGNAPEPVLEADAQKQRAIYLIRPWRSQDFLRALTGLLTQAVDAAPRPASS